MAENTDSEKSETELEALREEVAQLKDCIAVLERENTSLTGRMAEMSHAEAEEDGQEVDIETDTLVVGRDCRIEGSIQAKELIVYGAVEGRIEATAVSLMSSAMVTGELLHGTLAVETGAVIEARIRQRAPRPAAAPSREEPGREEAKAAPAVAPTVEKGDTEPAPQTATVTPLVPLARPAAAEPRQPVPETAQATAKQEDGGTAPFLKLGTAGDRSGSA